MNPVMLSSSGMSDLLSELALVVTQVLTWVGTVASTIVSTPLLLVTTGFLMIGGAIGIFGRLLSKNQFSFFRRSNSPPEEQKGLL